MRYLLVRQWRFNAADIAYKRCDKATRNMIDCDVNRYLKWNKKLDKESRIQRLNYCLLTIVEFRNVFYFRVRNRKFWSGFSKLFLKPADGVEIGGDIAEGLFISHRHAVVFPKKAGKNLRVGPGVVIGKNRGECPEIGNNVYIASNSTVIGGIHIGDNVIIGAGSVVTKDVPSDGVYAGNPVKLIRQIKDDPDLCNEIM